MRRAPPYPRLGQIPLSAFKNGGTLSAFRVAGVSAFKADGYPRLRTEMKP